MCQKNKEVATTDQIDLLVSSQICMPELSKIGKLSSKANILVLRVFIYIT